MEFYNITVSYEGSTYAGYEFGQLPFGAAKAATSMLIDSAADNARSQILRDPFRALEYARAASEAAAFKAANYQGEMPRAVKSWAEASKLAPKEAADSILRKAAMWDDAMYEIRDLRLKGKARALETENHEAAKAVVVATTDAIYLLAKQNAGIDL
ncbi:hypothetical protein BUE93_01565 [Chromobacterium amazonense]|uniref:Phage tail protein n=1 Tax=Chromobacterium amazonense TaxID=1382803 RepID=A0A2S9X9N1_9NEIS|nr:hypothetical protein [Chromobacterium amazonense]PRP72448.1 hypothetical protein BUE93_01565 [Chromobacterium amazonense]